MIMEQFISNKVGYEQPVSQQVISDMLNIRTVMRELRILRDTPNRDTQQNARYEQLRIQLHGFVGASN